ncbi:MAG: ATP-binding protein [Thermoanaerobaculia bacterium]
MAGRRQAHPRRGTGPAVRERLGPVLHSAPARYGVALGATAVAAGGTALMSQELSQTGLLFFYAAILASSWLAGTGPGVVATIAALVAADVLFLSAQDLPERVEVHLLAFTVFAVSGTLVARTVALGRSAREEAEAASRRALAARDRDRFLARVSRELMARKDLDGVLESLARQVVPELADYAVVYIIEERGPLRRGASAHADPEQEALVQQLLAQGPGAAHSSRAAAEAVRTGEPVLLAELTIEWLREQGFSPAQLRILERLGPRSVLIVPLVAREATVGVLGMAATDRSGRRYSEENLQLARELAVHAALAVEKARQYERAERAIAQRDEILAIVAHDLRNPLQVVTALAETLALRAGAQEGDTMGRIRRSLDQADRVIQELLDVSRLDSGVLTLEREPVEVQSLVDEAAQTARVFSEDRGVRVQTEIENACPPVYGDRQRLLQVFWNLLENAVRFTPAGGRVDVAARPAGPRIRFEVSDQGPGIAEEDLPLLFDRFWQARKTQRGAGLGLAIVKGLVEAHGGTIRVRSEPGRGSTFVFEIPVVKESGTRLAFRERHA